MAHQVKVRWGPITFTPTSYSADQTFALRNFSAGEMMHEVFVQTDVAFDGTGGRTVAVGDSGVNGRFAATGDTDITTAANFAQGLGTSGPYIAIGRHLYTAATTVNLYFTAATGGGPTAGRLRVWGFYTRVRPN